MHQWVGQHIGGTETHIKELAYRLAKRGHEVHVITNGGEQLKKYEPPLRVWPVSRNWREPPFPRTLKQDGRVPIYVLMFAIKVFTKIVALRLNGIKFDVISVHWTPEALISIFLKLFFRTPNVFVFEGYTKHEARVAKFADLQIAVSRDIVNKCSSNGYRPVHIPLGIDISRYKVSGEAIRRKLCNDDEKLVLTICRLDPRKDILTLVSAAKIVKEKDPKVRFVIVGEGLERGKIQEKIKELNLFENVKIERVVPAGPEYFRAGDIFVLPSLYEGFGIVFLEAMSSELPIISTTAGAIPEVVGDAGILVPPGNPEILADMILQLVSDDELRRRLKEKGLDIAKKYEWDALITECEKAYESVIKKPKAGT